MLSQEQWGHEQQRTSGQPVPTASLLGFLLVLAGCLVVLHLAHEALDFAHSWDNAVFAASPLIAALTAVWVGRGLTTKRMLNEDQ
jgi:hypothetical protein